MKKRMRIMLAAMVVMTLPVLAQQGPVETDADTTAAICTLEYMPVCGAVQVECVKEPCYPIQETFGNRCMLDAQGAEFLYEGACTQPGAPREGAADIACTLEYMPVCGLDGETYANECMAEVAGTSTSYPGTCQDLEYCASFYDGCNTCMVGEDGTLACTKMACEEYAEPECKAFVDEVKTQDTIILDTEKKAVISSVLDAVTADRKKVSIQDQKKYYNLLADAIQLRVQKWKDFEMVASFTVEGALQHRKQIVSFSYIHFLLHNIIKAL